MGDSRIKIKQVEDLQNQLSGKLSKAGGSISGSVQIEDDLILDQGLIDYTGDPGTSGYFLMSTGSKIRWIDILQNGISGYSGYSGISGYTGVSGYSGVSGTSGYSGTAGSIGSSGPAGTSGFSGISGYSGSTATNYWEPITGAIQTAASLGNVAIVPATTQIQNIGSSSKRWNDLFLGHATNGSTIDFLSYLEFSDNGGDFLANFQAGQTSIQDSSINGAINIATPNAFINIDETSNGQVYMQATGKIGMFTPNMFFYMDESTSEIFAGETNNGRGIQYDSDYSASFVNRSLVDKEYVDSLIGQYLLLSGGILTGNLTGRNIFPSSTNTYSLGDGSARWNIAYINQFNILNSGGYEIFFSGAGGANIYQSNPSSDIYMSTNGGHIHFANTDGGEILSVMSNKTRIKDGTEATGRYLKSSDSTGVTDWVDLKDSFGISIGTIGGPVITTGTKGYVRVPFTGTITGWTILSDVSGSIVIDVWKDTYANFPPTVADTIAGTEKPTLSSAIKNQDTSLSTWTTSVTEGDIIAFNVDSATSVTWISLSIHITRK